MLFSTAGPKLVGVFGDFTFRIAVVLGNLLLSVGYRKDVEVRLPGIIGPSENKRNTIIVADRDIPVLDFKSPRHGVQGRSEFIDAAGFVAHGSAEMETLCWQEARGRRGGET